MENPLLDPEGLRYKTLLRFDYTLSIIFAVECSMKIIVFGFAFNGPFSYLRSGWNILDFVIVLFSSISLAVTNVDLSIFKVAKLLRILRPLRVVSQNKSLKLLISSLIMAIPSVMQVILITIFLALILGITGVSYFKGALYSCNNRHTGDQLYYDNEDFI
jgi:hypothetical protein